MFFITFPHLHVRDRLSGPNVMSANTVHGKHSAPPGTTPSPQEAVSPFNFSGDSRSYTTLGKRVGKEQKGHSSKRPYCPDVGLQRHGESEIKH